MGYFLSVIFFIPFSELAEAVAEWGVWLKAEVLFEWSGVGIGYWDITWLHSDEFFVGLKVIIFWKDAGVDEFFLNDLDEV